MAREWWNQPLSKPIAFLWIAVLLVLLTAWIIPALVPENLGRGKVTTASTMKRLSMTIYMYRTEDPDGFMPPLAANGSCSIELRTVYPEYLPDLGLVLSPGSLRYDFETERNRVQELIDGLSEPNLDEFQALFAESFIYLNWIVQTREDAEALLKARAAGLLDRNETDVDVDGHPLFRITEDRVDSGVPVAAAEIPILIEAYPPVGQGRNVAYADGHVEYIKPGSGEWYTAADLVERFLVRSGK